MFSNAILSLLAIAGTAMAWDAPGYGGLNLVWQDNFAGSAGSAPDGNKWNVINGYLNVNAEWEVYPSSNKNVQRSGGNTLQIIPWRDNSAQHGWTSGRVESKYTFTPQGGKLTRVEASLKFGDATGAAKQGIWPAFWALGDGIRHNVPWPQAGELDIMERVNGALTGYGTAHCDVYPGGICNEGTGIGSPTSIPDQGFHTWRLEVDRRKSSWRDETITWFIDGRQFQQITGARINNQNVWNSLAHSPFFFICNVAVGGTWPGYPTGQTQDGYGSMMEVGYVAHYSS